MSKKSIVLIIVIVVAVGLGAYWYARPTHNTPTNRNVPQTNSNTAAANVQWLHKLTIGATATYPDGFTIKLVHINDSRCKKGVVCIWAGELAAEVELSGGALGSETKPLILGQTTKPTVTEGPYTLTLESITETTATISVKK
jgi:hypothetical protein